MPPSPRTRLADRPRPNAAVPPIDLEAPLYTTPYPLHKACDTCLDTRDLDLDDGIVVFRDPRD